jgi:hypothetical protein
MRMASVPQPTPVTRTGVPPSRPAISSEASTATAAPSDIWQMSRMVSGVATMGEERTSSTVSAAGLWA